MQIEKAMPRRSAFRRHEETLVSVAHDLRLPLCHIKGFVTTLRRTDVEWDEQTRSDFLAEIELETDRLTDLVDSLLQHGYAIRKGASNPQLEFTHPVSVVDAAIRQVCGPVADRVVSRNVSSNLMAVRMNGSQMERVLANLIHNAFKYAPSGTPIEVSAQITPDSELEFKVEDRGPGIPAADREQIFQPYFRSRAKDGSDVRGYGLGLAICQSIVQAHGGRMAVTDRQGGGSSFSVLLPLQTSKGQVL